MTLRILLVFYVLASLPIHSQNKPIWTFETSNRVYSSTIIENNILYIGSGDEHLYALDKKTKKKHNLICILATCGDILYYTYAKTYKTG